MSILYKDEHSGIELEHPVADFYDQELLEKPETIYRIDDGERFYYTLGPGNEPTFYGSITSIKGKTSSTPRPIIQKEISMGTKAFKSYVRNRQQLGSFLHQECARAAIEGSYDFDAIKDRIEYYASGWQAKDISAWKERIAKTTGEYPAETLLFDIIQSISKPPVEYTDARYGKKSWVYETRSCLAAWMEFIKAYRVKFLAVELPLSHPDGFASTIDYVLERDKNNYTEKTPPEKRKRITTILDIKTGNIFPGYEVQLFANQRAFNYHYPTIKIDRLENWTYRFSQTTPFYVKDQTGKCTDKQLDAILHIWKQQGKTKPRDITVLNGTVKAGESAMERYQTIPVEEFIKQKHESINQ